MSIPDTDNLAVCNDHGIMMHARKERRECVLCSLDETFEVRRDKEIPGEEIKQVEVRQRLESEDLKELLPLMDEYLHDIADDPELYLTVGKYEGDMPAGYSEAQESAINVVMFRTGAMERCITKAPNAQETIETLKEEGYGG